MKSALSARNWQVFLIIGFGYILTNFTIEDDPSLTLILTITGTVIYFLWPLIIGHELYQLLPERIELSYNFFIINSFIWLTTYIIVMVISDGQGMKFSGFEALPGFYIIYAIMNYMAFPARALKSLELGRKAELGEYIGDFFLVVFLPVGIWFLQPRINKIAKEQDAKDTPD